jgi:hypothetical protein
MTVDVRQRQLSRHCEERSDEATQEPGIVLLADRWIASLRSQLTGWEFGKHSRCHGERSEAIRLPGDGRETPGALDCFVAVLLAMTIGEQALSEAIHHGTNRP